MYTHKISYEKYNQMLDMFVQVSFRTTENALYYHKKQILGSKETKNFKVELYYHKKQILGSKETKNFKVEQYV